MRSRGRTALPIAFALFGIACYQAVPCSRAASLFVRAAGRPSIHDKVAFVLSFGGHGDLGGVLHYLATGEAVRAPGVVTHPPHGGGLGFLEARLFPG